jgi:sulfatase modifying factor 1
LNRDNVMRSIFSIPAMLVFGLASLSPALADDYPMTPNAPIKPVEMVLIKGGCYRMGDTFGDGADNEKPVHEVCVQDFYLSKYLITQIQWAGLMGLNPSKETDCGLNCPVENVSWNEVQEFIAKASKRDGKAYRLPTEAEWEYAARSGGKSEKWAGTSDEHALGDYAWYYENAQFHSHAVGEKKPNDLGLYDMTGNVWEWMSDGFDERYYAASPKDEPQGDAARRLRALRGGYWGDLPRFVRVTRRIGLPPTAKAAGYGFRVALSVQ